MMNTIIKKATLSDIEAITTLREKFCKEDKHDFDRAVTVKLINEIITTPKIGEVHVAKIDRIIVGYCFFALTYSLEWDGRDAWFDELYIVPSSRGGGLGSKFIETVKERATELGASYLHLEAMDDNVKVHPYYEKHGFKRRKSGHYVTSLIHS